MELKNYLPKKWIESPLLIYKSSIEATKFAISSLVNEVRNALKKYFIKDLSIFLVGLDEVVTNIAEHALKFQKKRKINIFIYYGDDKYAVLLSDTAEPFDPKKKKAKSPKKQFDKGADGGYGMYLYKSVFAKMEYFPEKSKNISAFLFDPSKLKLTR